MASKAKKKSAKSAAASADDDGGRSGLKKAQRATSNVFAMFTQTQMEEFKETPPSNSRPLPIVAPPSAKA
ncbi:unnamed protein product [Cyprideis torosa]|uniref:Uncharacterized protein n=1 Tax=Cyprideis torosa TaxID=163714 RepID=A0A7R8WB91_9CRUS|nr:unnamed protein product [Cyprideis torosa]CAG0889289.1 unnamed protein product [Cyprideis torosa]